METFKAEIVRTDQKTSLVLNVRGRRFDIILTDNNPNNVKTVFNNLLKELKNGNFNFELDDSKEDLYHHISIEYINQLNTELTSIYKELEDYNLLNE